MTQRRTATLDLEQLLTYRLSALYGRISTATARDIARHSGLSLREWRVLAMLARHEPLSGSELVARCIMDKASVSRGVAGLVERKLVAAAPHPKDGRAQLLRLTAKGWELYARMAPRSKERQAALLAPFDAHERLQLFSLLERLERRMDELFEPPAD